MNYINSDKLIIRAIVDYAILIIDLLLTRKGLYRHYFYLYFYLYYIWLPFFFSFLFFPENKEKE